MLQHSWRIPEMPVTTYTIRYSKTMTVTTSSPDVAEMESEAGYPVTAATEGDDA